MFCRDLSLGYYLSSICWQRSGLFTVNNKLKKLNKCCTQHILLAFQNLEATYPKHKCFGKGHLSPLFLMLLPLVLLEPSSPRVLPFCLSSVL